MTKTVGRFWFDLDIHGASVTSGGTKLTAGCLHDDEIDAAVQMLKNDLDVVAEHMKRAVRRDHKRLALGLGEA